MPFELRHHLTISLDPAQLEIIMSGLSDLQAAVVENTAVTEAAIAALKALPSGDSDATIEALAQTIASNNAALQAAIPVAPASLSVSPTSLVAPTPGTPYSETLTIAGGTAPFSAQVTGSAPNGMTASVSGDVVSVSIPSPVSSTPPTTFSGTVEVTDSASPPNAATASFNWSF